MKNSNVNKPQILYLDQFNGIAGHAEVVIDRCTLESDFMVTVYNSKLVVDGIYFK